MAICPVKLLFRVAHPLIRKAAAQSTMLKAIKKISSLHLAKSYVFASLFFITDITNATIKFVNLYELKEN